MGGLLKQQLLAALVEREDVVTCGLAMDLEPAKVDVVLPLCGRLEEGW